MAHVVVAGPRRGAGQHREHRCGAVERLDLSLLIDAEHQRPFGRVEVQADDVADLGHEQRILGQLPRILPVGSQSERPPHPRHHRLRQTQMLSHRPRGPVCGSRRRGLQRRGDQRLDLVVTDHPGPTRPRLVEQPVETVDGKPVTPLGHHPPRHTQLLGDLRITRSPFAGKDDSRSHRQRLSATGPPCPRHQLRSLVIGQHHWNSNRTRHQPSLLSEPELTTHDTSSP